MARNAKATASAWKGGLLAAAVITIVAVGLMAVMQIPSDSKGDVAKAAKKKGKRDRKSDRRDTNSLDPKGTYIAKLTGGLDCEWADEKEISQGNHLQEGQEVDLVSGFAEITFHSGAQVILEGPTKFKIMSRTSGFLTAGKMAADVPDDVQKFTINTPVARIVDVDFCETEGEPESGKPTRLGPGESIRLGPGESIRID